MKNNVIREALTAAGMKQWQLADLLGISEPTLTRWLRHELPQEKQAEIVAVIEGGGKNERK